MPIYKFHRSEKKKRRAQANLEHVKHANLQVSQLRTNVTWFTQLMPVSNRQRWINLVLTQLTET